MNRIVFFFLSMIFLSSCDDGKIEVASFDFTATNLKSCNEGIPGSFFLYTIKDKRAMIIKISETNFENQISNIIPPLTIDGTNKVTYREYAGNISNDNICGFPTNVSVALEKEWRGVGGTIKIETAISKSENVAAGSSSYDSYNHTITLINPSFDNGTGGQQKSDIIFLGAYTKPNLNKLVDFTADLILKKCPTSNNYFKISNNQSLVLNVDNTIFDTSILDTPKTRIIDGTNNKFTFWVHNSPQSISSFCGAFPPASTSILENWSARNAGTIEVVTTTVPGSNPVRFKHTVKLLNVVVEKSPLFFILGTSYSLGSFEQ